MEDSSRRPLFSAINAINGVATPVTPLDPPLLSEQLTQKPSFLSEKLMEMPAEEARIISKLYIPPPLPAPHTQTPHNPLAKRKSILGFAVSLYTSYLK